MAFCPCCDNDGWHEEVYTPEYPNDGMTRVFKRCYYCGCESEGVWYQNDEDGWSILPNIGGDDEYTE